MSDCTGTIEEKGTGCLLMYKTTLDAEALGSCEGTYAGCSMK
jgi:hypothetical protein